MDSPEPETIRYMVYEHEAFPVHEHRSMSGMMGTAGMETNGSLDSTSTSNLTKTTGPQNSKQIKRPRDQVRDRRSIQELRRWRVGGCRQRMGGAPLTFAVAQYLTVFHFFTFYYWPAANMFLLFWIAGRDGGDPGTAGHEHVDDWGAGRGGG